MYVIYVDIMTGENQVVTMHFIYWSVCLSSKRGGIGVKWCMGVIVILAHCK